MICKLISSAILIGAISAQDLWVDENGKFKVLQITDIHYGESDDKDQQTSELVEKLIQWERPDVAVLTGDMVSGYAWDHSEGWYKRQWNKWTQPFVNQNQTYMYIQGNHDSQADLDRDEVTDIDIQLDISLTQKGPSNINGSTNYVKAVYDHTKTKKLFYLWAFDSMSDDCEGVSGWGCIYPSQVAWYRQKSQELIKEDGKILPGYAFFHIPLPEFQDMWNLNTIYGWRNEEVCCQSVDTGLYAAFKLLGNIQAVFCGHDHNNDFWGDYNGIKLFYGRKTGYGGYGPSKFMQRGARVLEFTVDAENLDVSMDSWIREENGNKHTHQWKFPWWAKQKQNYCAGMKPHENEFIAQLNKSTPANTLDALLEYAQNSAKSILV